MKIVPYHYIEDLENEEAVGIESISVTYIQPADTCSDRDDVQTLKITAQTGCAYDKELFDQGKEGYYFDIEIPEGHWSVDSGEQLTALIDDFKQRIYLNQLDKHDIQESDQST